MYIFFTRNLYQKTFISFKMYLFIYLLTEGWNRQNQRDKTEGETDRLGLGDTERQTQRQRGGWEGGRGREQQDQTDGRGSG